MGCNSCRTEAMQRISLGKMTATQGLMVAFETRDLLSAVRSCLSSVSNSMEIKNKHNWLSSARRSQGPDF